MKRIETIILGASVALAPLACTEPASSPAPEAPAVQKSTRALGPCDPVNIDESLVIHDQATLTAANFSFQRTIQAIRTTSGGSATTDADVAQSLTSGLLNTSFNNPVSGLGMAANPRPAEAGLTGAGLLSDMEPIALFNRFDLAPANGANCGEYRIVYGRYPNSTFNRYLVIFEARLPNPNPGMGLAGCAPVANFWHNLSDPAVTPAQRAADLANFYYNGLPGFSAVVNHDNYGMPLGQVRTNMFMQGPWQLREWRTSFNGSGQPVFSPDTVKDNPLAEFYDETSFASPPLFGTEQADFVTEFTGTNMNNLLHFELNGSGVAACPEINSVGAEFANRFNEFQSVSQGIGDDPDFIASPSFRTSIDGVLSGNPAFTGITNTHVLNRAGTVTCGGCHQFSVGRTIAPGVTWPGVAPGGFAHVRELGATPPAVAALSPALNNCFLPARKQFLETFVCNSGGGMDGGVSDSGTTPDAGTTPDSGVTPDAGPTSCGGPYGNTCAPNEYCDFGAYNVCGQAGPGVCAPRPAGCIYGGTPVCGCDGQTYTNACFANAAGTDVASSGACGGGGSCNIRPPAGCCFEDAQCSRQVRGGQCVGEDCSRRRPGVCKAPAPKGQCWEDTDCPRGATCEGESICPCGALCLVPDQPGRCRLSAVISPAPAAQSSQTLASADSEPEDAARAEVEAAKQQLLSAPDAEARSRALEDLEAAVEDARAEERALPGAFWPTRRTH